MQFSSMFLKNFIDIPLFVSNASTTDNIQAKSEKIEYKNGNITEKSNRKFIYSFLLNLFYIYFINSFFTVEIKQYFLVVFLTNSKKFFIYSRNVFLT